MNEFNQGIIKDFCENAGIVGGIFRGAPMILITHKGAKSGKTYVSPLVYSRDGDRYLIIASKGGARTHPDWYHNLVANPEITVEIGKEKFKARAKTTSGTERERLFDAQAKMMPQFNQYKAATKREIPVFVLERI
jgi:deazaflavin-dependent oxidoreductase (nitroreductase family)